MNLRTTVNVTVSSQGVVPYTGKLISRLGNVEMLPNVRASWSYHKEDGTVLTSGIRTFTAEEEAGLFLQPITSKAVFEQVAYEVFKMDVMATFSLTSSQVIIE